MIIPMLLFVIYLYIMLLISLLQQSDEIHKLVEVLYESEDVVNSHGYQEEIAGESRSLHYEEDGDLYPFSIQWKCYKNDAVESIRRWQIAADIIS